MPQRGSRISNDRRVFAIEPRVNARDVKQRLAERDQRIASDNRTDAQRWLGDPEPARSALRQHTPAEIAISQLVDRLRQRSAR